MLTKEELPACPVATLVEIIGNKWKLLIIRNLLARTYRFGELKSDLAGIIIRKAYVEIPPIVDDLGNSLRLLFKDMEN